MRRVRQGPAAAARAAGVGLSLLSSPLPPCLLRPRLPVRRRGCAACSGRPRLPVRRRGCAACSGRPRRPGGAAWKGSERKGKERTGRGAWGGEREGGAPLPPPPPGCYSSHRPSTSPPPSSSAAPGAQALITERAAARSWYMSARSRYSGSSRSGTATRSSRCGPASWRWRGPTDPARATS